MFISKKSIIHISNQTKKWNALISLLLASGTVVILGVLALSLDFNLSEQQETVCFLLVLAGIAFSGSALIGLSLFIKCPHCKLKWFWYGISKDVKHNIMIGYMRHCQRCNYPQVLE